MASTTETIEKEDAPRISHRRTRSAAATFSTEASGPGAFTPLTGLPRRQRQFEKRTLFQIAPDDDDELETAPPLPTPQPPTPPAQLDKSRAPQITLAETPATPPVSDIPFPTSSTSEAPIPFPSFDRHDIPASRSSSISRTGSTPIVLANGKPLKPSLKSSLSSPHIGDWRSQHPRSKSEPPTPSGTKSVHFPERKDNLESVVVFEKTARPRAVSGNADDTETETEGYDSPANAAVLSGGSYFPPVDPNQLGIEIDGSLSSPVPTKEPSAFANVHVETLVFPRTRPPTLRGSILVKNVAFEKSVALRFTLDNWQTTSEVVCKYVCSLPSLPSPFPPDRASPGVPTLTWDRFSFLVRLEDVERKLAERTIFFAARYQASGVGEWWDNNNGANYKLVFKKIASGNKPTPSQSKPSPLRYNMGDGPKRMFPDLDLRPSTMSVASDEVIPPLRLKKPFHGASASLSSKGSVSSPIITNVNAVTSPPPGPQTSQMGAHNRSASTSSITSSGSSGSLRLSNYASPTSPVIPVSGPTKREPINVGPIVGGQPITSPPPSATAEPTTNGLGVPTPNGPSLLQRRSPTNSLASTLTTPVSAGGPITPATPNGTALLPQTQGGDKTPSATNDKTPSTTSYGGNRMSYPFNTDSSYAALVEKWCFHQSPPPPAHLGGSTLDGSPSSEVSTPGLGSELPVHTTTKAFQSTASGYGSGYGYGHHQVLGKPLTLKP